jgi:hypothetical protein
MDHLAARVAPGLLRTLPTIVEVGAARAREDGDTAREGSVVILGGREHQRARQRPDDRGPPLEHDEPLTRLVGAPGVGLEPTTLRLTAECSAN